MVKKPTREAKPPQNLLQAIQAADLDAARAFLDAGAALNPEGDDVTQTPLDAVSSAALSLGEAALVPIAALLLARGADPNHAPPPYCTQPLHRAAYCGYDKIAQLLVDAGASISDTDRWDHHTMLHSAASGGLRWLVERALEAGIDPNAPSKQGHRALHYAFKLDARNGAKDPLAIAERLVASGADLHANTPSWGTALHWAAANLHADGVRWLVARGIPVDAREQGPEGQTALMRAAWRVGDGKLQTLDALLSLGADVHATCPGNGVTALHYAAYAGDVEGIGALLAAGANKGAKSTAGFNLHSMRFKAKALPADVARRRKHEAAAALLA